MLSGQHMALMKGVIILLMYWACGQMLASLSTQGSSRVLASATILTKDLLVCHGLKIWEKLCKPLVDTVSSVCSTRDCNSTAQ